MTAAVTREVPALRLYDRALLRAANGSPARLTLHDDAGGVHVVDPARWCRPELPGDRALLARCAGPTLDVGCGPGRLTGALNRAGRPALGIDISAAAVRLARQRGATAVRRDVFRPVRDPGRWGTVVLADGNIGIGGDPVALLRRCHHLVSVDGRVQVETAAPGTRSWAGPAVLTSGDVSAPMRWAVVAAGDLGPVARPAGLRVLSTWTEAGRWFATLARR